MERSIRKNSGIEILSAPNTWSKFLGVSQMPMRKVIRLTTESGVTLKCTPEHKIMVDDGIFTEARLLEIDNFISNPSTVDGFDRIVDISDVENPETVYDIIEVNKGNRYFTDCLISHNCEFLGSSMTLISGSKLAQISWSTPIETEANAFGFKFYEQVDREHTYVMTVDTARGSGLDYSAFIVFDTSTVPFKVVCTFRNNNVSTIIFPKYIIEAATYYNNCYILVETNDLGQQVVDILREDLDYDGLISTAARTRGHEASSGFNVASQTGVRTTKTVKRLGCSTFKSIVESDQLVINDHDLFEEMTRFTYKKGSYEAENGHDDLVMCGVLFAWLTTQPYFKELTNTDIVRNIYGLGTADMDDMIVPFGVIDTGHDSPYSVDSGDLWTEL